MRRSLLPSIGWAIVLMFVCSPMAEAQGWRASEPEPASSPYLSARGQASQIPMLGRSIDLDLKEIPLQQALAQIAARAGLRLTYSTDLLREERRVSLHASSITAAEAVLRVLHGTSLDLLVSASGNAVLVQCSTVTCGAPVGRPGTQAVQGAAMMNAHARDRVIRAACARRCHPARRDPAEWA